MREYWFGFCMVGVSNGKHVVFINSWWKLMRWWLILYPYRLLFTPYYICHSGRRISEGSIMFRLLELSCCRMLGHKRHLCIVLYLVSLQYACSRDTHQIILTLHSATLITYICLGTILYIYAICFVELVLGEYLSLGHDIPPAFNVLVLFVIFILANVYYFNTISINWRFFCDLSYFSIGSRLWF